MVATRALRQSERGVDTEADLRRCVRDLVALSSLPAIWIRADARQIADSLAQLIVSVLDVEFACVILKDPLVEIVHRHDRIDDGQPLDLSALLNLKPNITADVNDPHRGRMRAACVPIGTEDGSALVALSRRATFPLETEQMLMRVAANQAAIALQRWRSDCGLLAQKKELECLNETGAALYEFTDRLYRAQSVDDVYEAALDAIAKALRCTRASILLFDDQGIMRFVAWRGLSAQYRQAVEGHTPWRPGDTDVEPIFIDDIELTDEPDALKATIRAEGVRALGFIPIVANGGVIGKFMTYYESPHAFEAAENDLSLTIARQLGFSIERRRADDARRRAEEDLRANVARERARAAELQAVMESVPAVIWIARDPDCTTIEGNRASYDFLRLPLEMNPSLSNPNGDRPAHFEVFSGGRLLPAEELPVQRAARGEYVSNFEAEHRFDDGTCRYLLGNAAPLHGEGGDVRGAVAAFVDITDRKKAEETRDLLIAELSHRVKNTLAIVISIARQSFGKTKDPDEAREAFDARIRALAHTHGRLAEGNWSGVSLETMLLDEFAPYRGENGTRVTMSGPRVVLSPKSAVTLGMATHELATNAAKYGALSVKEGSVEVVWSADLDTRQLRISWTEAGGPRVAPPQRSGFGRLLLERALTADLNGKVCLDFSRDGLRCEILLPLEDHLARVEGR